MRPLLRFVALVAVFVSTAACQKAEFEKASADTVVVLLSAESVNADEGTLTATAQALQDGVPVLGLPIRFTVTGTNPVAEQSVDPDESTGFATVDFSALDVAGAGTVSVATGNPTGGPTASTTFTVVAGAPASLAFQVVDPTIIAGETATYSTTVLDAFSNPIANPPILFTTTSEEAAYVSGGLIEFRRAGDWDVNATVTGTALAEQVQVTVSANDAAQVVTALDRSVAGELQTVQIQCNELDTFSNDRTAAGTFTATSEVFTTPASTIAAVAGTDGLFTASGFTSTGAYTATCLNGAFTDVKPFAVVPQLANNSVVATVSQNLVDAGLTLTVNCKELDVFGQVLPTAAGDFTFTLPTNPSGATHDAGAGDGDATDGIDFIVGGGQSLDVTGAHLAQCARGALTPDTEDFVVVDLTAPVITQADLTAATGPNGVTADQKYAPDETLTVTIDATDFVGIRRVDLVATGPAQGTFAVVSSTSLVDHTRTVTVDGNAATFAGFTLSVRVSDAFGNESTLAVTPASFQVDPAAGIAQPAGVTMRTYHEQPEPTLRPRALASDGTVLYVLRADYATEDFNDIAMVAGLTSGALTSITTGTFPAAEAGIGLVARSTAFGPASTFFTLYNTTPEVAALSATNGYVSFSPGGAASPWDLDIGDLGTGEQLFYSDFSTDTIYAVDTTGAATAFASPTVSGPVPLTVDAANSRLLVPDASGALFAISSAGAQSTVLGSGSLPNGIPFDIHLAGGKTLVAFPVFHQVARVNGVTVEDEIETGLLGEPVGLASIGTTLYVLDVPVSGGTWRIYRVTGY